MHKTKKLCAWLLAAVVGFSLAACGSNSENTDVAEESGMPQTAPSSVSVAESITDSTPEGTAIVLSFDGTEMTALLDNSETSQAFIERLPMTLSMSRYGDREYYAAIEELPENGEHIEDFENGDLTYYTTGRSLAIFFGNAENSNQDGLIRMGRITSDLNLFDAIGDTSEVTIALSESGDEMQNYDFSQFTNVEITGIDLSALTDEQLSVLYRQARYCQAMTEADTETMAELVAEDVTFTHMSGRTQTREEYFSDIEDGSLRYYTIGIENPTIEVEGDNASITYTSVLNANAYGAQGTYRMSGTHCFEMINGQWMSTRKADQGE